MDVRKDRVVKAAQSTDWTISAMPATRYRLAVERVYPDNDFARLTFGVVPNSMDEKWFVYYERPWLHVHRSSSGACIYQLRFEPTETGNRIAEAIVNADPSQYRVVDPEGEAGRLFYLLDSVVRRNGRYVPTW